MTDPKARKNKLPEPEEHLPLLAEDPAIPLEDRRDEIGRYIISRRDAAAEVYRLLCEEICPLRKVRYQGRAFPCRCTVDDLSFGTSGAELALHIETPEGDRYGAADLWLQDATRQEKSAMLVLGDTGFSKPLEASLRYRQYFLMHTYELEDLPLQVRRTLQREAEALEARARTLLEKAVLTGKAYVCGASLDPRGHTARERMEFLFAALVQAAYDKLSLIRTPTPDLAAVSDILQGTETFSLFSLGGDDGNPEAQRELQQWLEGQFAAGNHPTLEETCRQFAGIPYGWQSLDIAALLAHLLEDRTIVLLAGGGEVSILDPELPAMLCGRTVQAITIAPKREMDPDLLVECASFLRRWLDRQELPGEPDELIHLLRDTLQQRDSALQRLSLLYPQDNPYPGKAAVLAARERLYPLLQRRIDRETFLRQVLDQQGDLFRDLQATAPVFRFFQEQQSLFDTALARTRLMQKEKNFFAADPEALSALRRTADILAQPAPYDSLSELPALLSLLQQKYDAQCEHRQQEAKELIRHSMEDIRQLAEEGRDTDAIYRNAEVFFRRMGTDVRQADTLTRLDELSVRIADKKNLVCRQLEALGYNLPPTPTGGTVRTLRRYDLCSSARLSSKEEIGAYVDRIRAALEQALDGADSIQVL